PRGRILVIVLGFTVGAPALIWMSWTSVFVIAILVLLLFGIARGFSDANLMPVVRQVVDSRYAATAYGILNFLSTLAGGLMVYVGGALQDADIKVSAIYIGAAALLSLGTWARVLVKVNRES